MDATPTTDLERLATLDEPTRGRLYDWVIAQRRPVSRDEVAAGAGISRPLAAFHLDRLADAGLLAVEYRRLTGRSGPGAGRPAKLYRRAPRQVSASVPPRTYQAAAELLADAVEQLSAEVPPPVLREAAAAIGRDVGLAARRAAGPRAGRGRLEAALLGALTERGYEPTIECDEIRLGNCPFDALVADHRQLVCGMNLALADGLLDGLVIGGLQASLAPEDGYCCVRISRGPGA